MVLKINDVIQYALEMEGRMELFQVPTIFRDEFLRRYHEIGDAIAKEHNITESKAMTLPLSTPLGLKSTELFSRLKDFLA